MAINKETTVQKLISMPKELAEEIANYRFAHRFRSEAEAVRALIQKGLECEEGRDEGSK